MGCPQYLSLMKVDKGRLFSIFDENNKSDQLSFSFALLIKDIGSYMSTIGSYMSWFLMLKLIVSEF